MKTETFQRKTFTVDAVQVTKENLTEVAEWCQGEVRGDDRRRYIKVRVLRPMSERQCCAYVGDWVLHAGAGYKVYSNAAFHKSFESVPTQRGATTTGLFETEEGVIVRAQI